MGKTIQTQINIQATPEKVWNILTNTKAYSSWNPFIESLEGDLAIGKRIKVQIRVPEKSAMVFTPKILEFQPNKKLEWLGNFILPGIFDGQHSFEIIDHKNGSVTFIQNEVFKGILASIYNTEQAKKGFELMNQKLKELAETY